MSRYFLTCMCLCALLTSRAQNPGIRSDSSVSYAIRLERAFFETSDPVRQNEILLEKAGVYHESGDFEKAMITLERLHYYLLSKEMQMSVYLDAAVNAFLSGRYKEVNAFCEMALSGNSSDSLLISEIYYLLTLSNNELLEYDSAQKYAGLFLQYSIISNGKRDSLCREIDAIYREGSLPVFRDPQKAEKMSAYLPGLGQCYAGHCVEGAASFLTHLSLLTITGYAVYKTYYLSAYFGGVNLLMKFYFGSPARTKYLVNKRNYELKRMFSQDVKSILHKAI